MRKRELLAAAEDRRADTALKKAFCQMVKKEYAYSGPKYHYRYEKLLLADTILCEGREMLQISVWIHEEESFVDMPRFQVFMDREKKEYLTYDRKEEKWRKAKIDYLPRERWDCEWDVFESRETQKKITGYLENGEENGHLAVLKFQRGIVGDRLKRLHKKETDVIDEVMARVPQIPRGFEQWAENIGLLESRYIYYYYSRTVKEGYCTHCRKMVPVCRPKHNEKGICKRCHSNIIYKAARKAAVVCDKGKALLLQRMSNGEFILRKFEIFKKYEDFHKPYMSVFETERIVMSESMTALKKYVYERYRQTQEIRWCHYDYGWSMGNDAGRLYTYNLKQELRNTKMKYIPWSVLLTRTRYIMQDAKRELLKADRNAAVVEYFIKSRLYSLTIEFLRTGRMEDSGTININARNILGCLNCTREELKIMQALDGDRKMLLRIQAARKFGLKITMQQYKQMQEWGMDWNIIPYMKDTTPHKLLTYYQRQKETLQDDADAMEYRDYLSMRKSLDYDMADAIILFPKDLKAAHAQMVLETNEHKAEIRMKEAEEKYDAIAAMYEELDRTYHYEKGEFIIRPAKSASEIIQEGRLLHHCVGRDSYLSGHNEGKSYIFMLRNRKEPETPYYTVEYGSERIKQWYSSRDTKPDKDKIEKWLGGWEKELKKRKEKQETPMERIRAAI